MSRPLRIEFPGGLYHVTSRGDRREDIYLDDDDRVLWLATLAQCCERFNWVVYAWCQMGNHYHLVVEAVEGNLSAGMRQLNGVYTQAVNRRHQRVGHVFQGRYKAIVVNRESHLLELLRYVVLNPVRAGMVTDPGDWPWSAYPAMVGQAATPTWFNRQWALRQFGTRPAQQLARYQEFVAQGIGADSIWGDLKGQIFLGTDEFAQTMQEALERKGGATSAEIPRAQRRAKAPPLQFYISRFANNPKQGMQAAYATGDYTLQAVADAFGVHYSTVSRAVRVQ